MVYFLLVVFFRLAQQLILIKEKPHMKFKLQHFGYNSCRKTPSPFSMTLLNWLHGSKSKLSLQYSPLDRIQALTKNIYRKSCVIRHKIIWNMLLWFLEVTLHGKETYYGFGGGEGSDNLTHLNVVTYMTLVNNKACTAVHSYKIPKETLWTELDSIFHFMQKRGQIFEGYSNFLPNRNTKSELYVFLFCFLPK